MFRFVYVKSVFQNTTVMLTFFVHAKRFARKCGKENNIKTLVFSLLQMNIETKITNDGERYW